MAVIHLVHADLELLNAALAGDDALARALGQGVVPGWATFVEALAPTRDALASGAADSAWGTRFFVKGGAASWSAGRLQGPARRRRRRGRLRDRRGAAGSWVCDRGDAGDGGGGVRRRAGTNVIAHTLPERGPSNRVLEKAGFEYEGEAEEDGEVVWRFSLARGSGSSRP